MTISPEQLKRLNAFRLRYRTYEAETWRDWEAVPDHLRLLVTSVKTRALALLMEIVGEDSDLFRRASRVDDEMRDALEWADRIIVAIDALIAQARDHRAEQ